MKEILFRGQTINGDWVVGNLSVIHTGSYISNSFGIPLAYQVKPESIGQYIGINDRNGSKIFTGMTLRFDSDVKVKIATGETVDSPSWEIFTIGYEPPEVTMTTTEQLNSIFCKLPYTRGLNIETAKESIIIR